MGPIRGSGTRRKQEKKHDVNGSAASGALQKEGLAEWWEKLSKRVKGLWPSPPKCLDNFKSAFKVSRKTFEYVCSLVKDDMMVKSARYVFTSGRPMSLYDQVAVALRRLGTGESLAAVGDSFKLNSSIVAQVTRQFVDSMEERALQHLQWPSTEAEINAIKSKFEKMLGLPNCCGVIDATHILMCLPTSDTSSDVWLDHENNHSMVLQAIVDPDMKFRDIVTGWPGQMSDWMVFESSNFYKLCNKGERLNGKKLQLSEGTETREYIIGDAGYPLLPYLVVPYEGKKLPKPKAELNRMHLATLMVAQRALARLKERWGIIQGVMWRPDKHRLPRIILACCILHNIVIDMEDEEVLDEKSVSLDHDSNYHQLICEAKDVKGVALRENLSQYLTGRLTP